MTRFHIRPGDPDIVQSYEEITARRVRLSSAVRPRFSASEKSKFYLSMRERGGFGTGSPSWTIASGRRDPPPPASTPGPGHYPSPTGAIENSRARTIGVRADQPPERYAADFTAPRKFPDAHGPAIQERHYYSAPGSVSPGPSWVPPPIRGRSSSIGARLPQSDDTDAPGPGQYTPRTPGTATEPSYSVPRAEKTEPVPNRNPGPGEYNIGGQIPPAPKWTYRTKAKTARFQQLWNERERPWAQAGRPKSRNHAGFERD
jgi:hypothetical protein